MPPRQFTECYGNPMNPDTLAIVDQYLAQARPPLLATTNDVAAVLNAWTALKSEVAELRKLKETTK